MHTIGRTAQCFLIGAFIIRVSGAQTAPPSFAGKWSGGISVTMPVGKVVHDKVVLILKPSGNDVTGSVGQSEDKQSKIKDVHVDRQSLQFVIEDGQGMHLQFHLELESNRLHGRATGRLHGDLVSLALNAVRAPSNAPLMPSPELKLYNEIGHMDGVLFSAYNRRDLAAMKSLFTTDLEYYHDKAGLMNYKQNMDSFQRNFRGRTRMRRELAEGSLEVYPIAGYGAIEIGVHRFYSTEPKQNEKLTATARFLHVWRKTKTGWKIARIVSYDHR